LRLLYKFIIPLCILPLAFFITGCQKKEIKTVAIGSKHFTEQEILGEMMAILIEENTDIRVVRRLNLGGTMVCFNALLSGDIDLYAEYTGTGLVNILKMKAVREPDEAYGIVKDIFSKKYGLLWLRPFGFNNTYTLTMRKEQAKALGIERISDIIKYSDRLRPGFDAEFLERPDGYRGLKKHYGFEFAKRPQQMDPGLMYKALADEAVDVINGFATDGRIPAYGLVILRDDKNFFPPYYAAPLIREETLSKYPELAGLLDRLGGLMDDATMQGLNFEVDKKERSAREVAREFLKAKGLIP
jgi:osmoprotectant transport system substrate-binding protein